MPKKCPFAVVPAILTYLGLIRGVPNSRWRCASFSFRLEFWVCQDLVTGRIHRFLCSQKELFQDKSERWTTSESNICYYKNFLIDSHVKTGTKSHTGFH